LRTAVLACLLLVRAAGAASEPRRVLVLALDGLDWDVVRPLAAGGRLPNLSQLVADGSTGTMIIPRPLRSPAIWTTVATGVSPRTHGIEDFHLAGRRVASSDRRSEAVWESVSASSRSVAVVGWLATWPAETVRGAIVSDQALNPGVREGRIFPLDALSAFPVWAASCLFDGTPRTNATSPRIRPNTASTTSSSTASGGSTCATRATRG